MITKVVPQFFTSDLSATLQYYREMLGFEAGFVYGEPPCYAGAVRDGASIFFRLVGVPPVQGAEKYTEEFLDAYILVEDVDALYAEYRSRGVTLVREIGSMPWSFREFVVKDCDGRLLCFGQYAECAEGSPS